MGKEATLKSIFWSSSFTEKRPSWGNLFSAMFNSANSLTLAVTLCWSLGGIDMTSLRTPSTLKRTVTSRAWGSMWMSEAPSPTACCRMELTRRIIGFSSGPASIPRSNSPSSSAPSLRPPPPVSW